MSSPTIGRPLRFEAPRPCRVARDEDRDAVDHRAAGLERALHVEARGALGAHRQVVEQHLGAGIAQHAHHLGLVGLERVGQHEAAALAVLGHVRRDAVEHAPHPHRHAGLGDVGLEHLRAVRRGEDRLGHVAPDLARVHVEGRHHLEVAGPEAADLASASGRWPRPARAARSTRCPARASSRSCPRPRSRSGSDPVPRAPLRRNRECGSGRVAFSRRARSGRGGAPTLRVPPAAALRLSSCISSCTSSAGGFASGSSTESFSFSKRKQVHLRVGLAHARREQPEPLQVGHDLREGHLAEADHEGRALRPVHPDGHVPAEPFEDRLHQQPLAQQVARLDHEVLALAQLARAPSPSCRRSRARSRRRPRGATRRP